MAHVEMNFPPGHPIRLVDMVLDYMHFKKSTHWAHLVNDHHLDFYDSCFCRSSLRFRGEQLDQELTKFETSGFDFWDSQTFTYVSEQEQCFLGDVAEALLCLKRFNAPQFVNLDWKTKLDPNDTQVHEELARFQDLLLPDLNACLARRAVLVNRRGREAGLLQLAAEMATNYSLDPRNRAGEANLFLPFTIERGFVDIAGSRSGQRVVQFTFNAQRINDEFTVVALTAIRETLWYCSIAKPANWSLTQCFEDLAVAMPGFNVAWLTNNRMYPLANNRNFVHMRDQGKLKIYRYAFNRTQNDSIEYLPMTDITYDTGTETMYRDYVDRPLLMELLGDQIVWPMGMEMMAERCFVRDGCFSA